MILEQDKNIREKKIKIFSRSVFKVTGITYIVSVMAYAIGYTTHTGGGFINLGPAFSGMVLAALASPTIFIISCIYILIKIRPRSLIFGYLILTVGVACLAIGIINTVNTSKQIETMRQYNEKKIKEDNFINSTIGPTIKNIYPGAGIVQDDIGQTVVKIGGYIYEQQPDYDNEIEKWKSLRQNATFNNYPHAIRIEYYFEGAENRFAMFHVGVYRWSYSRLGMTEEAISKVTTMINEHLKDYDKRYKIESRLSYEIDIFVYEKLDPTEESLETELWQDFMELNNINRELVGITIHYKESDESYRVRYYDVSHWEEGGRWYGGYN